MDRGNGITEPPPGAPALLSGGACGVLNAGQSFDETVQTPVERFAPVIPSGSTTTVRLEFVPDAVEVSLQLGRCEECGAAYSFVAVGECDDPRGDPRFL